MIKDKELKMKLLEQLMDEMDGRVLERDLKPKSKLVVKAEGDDPQKMKEEVVDKLSKLKLPSKEELAAMGEDMKPEMEMEGKNMEAELESEGPEMEGEDNGESESEGEMPESEMEGEEDYMDSMPLRMKEKLMMQKRMQKNKM